MTHVAFKAGPHARENAEDSADLGKAAAIGKEERNRNQGSESERTKCERGTYACGVVGDEHLTAGVEPRVDHDLVDGCAAGGVRDKEEAEEGLALCGHEEGHAVLAADDPLPQLLEIGPVKRKGPSHQREQDHTQRPDVNLGTLVHDPLEQLRRSVRRAASRNEQVSWLVGVRAKQRC